MRIGRRDFLKYCIGSAAVLDSILRCSGLWKKPWPPEADRRSSGSLHPTAQDARCPLRIASRSTARSMPRICSFHRERRLPSEPHGSCREPRRAERSQDGTIRGLCSGRGRRGAHAVQRTVLLRMEGKRSGHDGHAGGEAPGPQSGGGFEHWKLCELRRDVGSRSQSDGDPKCPGTHGSVHVQYPGLPGAPGLDCGDRRQAAGRRNGHQGFLRAPGGLFRFDRSQQLSEKRDPVGHQLRSRRSVHERQRMQGSEHVQRLSRPEMERRRQLVRRGERSLRRLYGKRLPRLLFALLHLRGGYSTRPHRRTAEGVCSTCHTQSQLP